MPHQHELQRRNNTCNATTTRAMSQQHMQRRNNTCSATTTWATATQHRNIAHWSIVVSYNAEVLQATMRHSSCCFLPYMSHARFIALLSLWSSRTLCSIIHDDFVRLSSDICWVSIRLPSYFRWIVLRHWLLKSYIHHYWHHYIAVLCLAIMRTIVMCLVVLPH